MVVLKQFLNTETNMMFRVQHFLPLDQIEACAGKTVKVEYAEFDTLVIDGVWYVQTERIGNLVRIERVVE